MARKIGGIGLILTLVLAPGAGLASPTDEQAILAAVSRDTGVRVERLQEEKAATGLSYGNLRMGHLVAEALDRSFEDVSRRFKQGQPWHEIASAAGLTLEDVERMALHRRQAAPQP